MCHAIRDRCGGHHGTDCADRSCCWRSVCQSAKTRTGTLKQSITFDKSIVTAGSQGWSNVCAFAQLYTGNITNRYSSFSFCRNVVQLQLCTLYLEQQQSQNIQSTYEVSDDEEEASPDRLQCREALKEGKKLLKQNQGAAAMVRFEKALMLSRGLGDKIFERRAVRGLAAAAKMQGQLRSAVKHLERVLQLSQELNEYTGDADAYGSMADIYAELNDFEKAAAYYDKYIFRMTDGSVV
eukprot:TRINITY_DN3665_c0_g1_i2.p3 TRINITY_DN3665_c0_g1~~TRINITY_DN3665_c0_g1_i2.p3  ORF type:complete len:238 (+),score=30.01 TRINITY_DN3665_c0_g1_i2:447-1160(+)